MAEERRGLSLVLRELRRADVAPACANYDPGQFELRDYFVEFKIPMVWISHPKDAQHSPAASWAEEAQFARELFQKLPANIPCLGWWDHGQGGEEGCGENGPYSGMDLASQYGKFEVCTAFDGYGPAWAISRSIRVPRRHFGRRLPRHRRPWPTKCITPTPAPTATA